MLFKPELLAKVLSGEKTQTRRLCKDGEFTWMKGRMGADRGYVPAYSEICHKNGKVRFVDGREYAACPGRGKVQEGRIRVVRMWREKLSDISEKDARAEGFANREAFFQAWDQINGVGKRDVYVWVLMIEAVR